jgi:hypothetical protein
VAIGGGLVLPYFYFPAPPRQDRDLLPDSAAFLEQTQGALGYYHRLFAEEALFDNLYAIGWQPLLEIKAYKEGQGAAQPGAAARVVCWPLRVALLCQRRSGARNLFRPRTVVGQLDGPAASPPAEP